MKRDENFESSWWDPKYEKLWKLKSKFDRNLHFNENVCKSFNDMFVKPNFEYLISR